MSFVNTFIEYLNYPMVPRALIVGILVAFCSSLLGVTLVLKRFSFIGDGLSHVAFGATSIAMSIEMAKNGIMFLPEILSNKLVEIMSYSKMIFVLPITIICAVVLLKSGKKSKISGDAQIALVSVAALAFGYMIIQVFGNSTNVSADVCTTLFGSTSILTLKDAEVWLCVALSVIVVIVFILFYNKIFAITFDENFSRGIGVDVDFYNFIIALIIAVIIVLAMNLVGSLLISALVIFPALSAMQVCKSFKSVTICACIYSVITTFLGLALAIVLSTPPVGSTIVMVELITFIVFYIVGKVKGGIFV